MHRHGLTCRMTVHRVAPHRSSAPGQWQTDRMPRKFIPLTEVSEVLGVSAAQAYALVRSGDLPAIKVGGRGQWRVEVDELDAYIERMYAQTREFVAKDSDRG